MNTLMKYKDYLAKIEFDDEDGLFVGHVIGLQDSLNFHGTSVNELQQAFEDCIENYFVYCKKVGKEPEKRYGGNFNVRVAPEVHREAVVRAAEEGVTLNQFVVEAIKARLKQGGAH